MADTRFINKMRNGWFNESYRHSLAARGVRTSYYRRVPLSEQDRYEIRRVFKRPSKKALLEDERDFYTDIIADQSMPSERKMEAMKKLAEIYDKLKHIPGAPLPVKGVPANADMKEGLFYRYKGKGGQPPDAILEYLGPVDLKLESEIKDLHRERRAQMATDERYGDIAEERMGNLLLRDVKPDVEQRSIFQITPEIIKEAKKGRQSQEDRDSDLRWNYASRRVDVSGDKMLAKKVDIIRGKFKEKKRKYMKYPPKKIRIVVSNEDNRIVFKDKDREYAIVPDNTIYAKSLKKRKAEERYVKGAPIFVLQKHYGDRFMRIGSL
jgi:hypothetical protein